MAVIILLASFFLSIILTIAVRSLMLHLRIVDSPKVAKRKIHKKTIPLGGGLALYLSFFIILFLLYWSGYVGTSLSWKEIAALFVGGTILMIGGLIDDRYPMKARYQLFFPLVATACVILYGIGPTQVTNPFGGILYLDQWNIHFGVLGTFVVFADLLVFFWLMGMMYTTKLLDGLDGLVTGIVAIGALAVFFLTQQQEWFQPEVGYIAIAFAGVCLGFLLFNWHPAKIFLGEGGSLFAGFVLGFLAIVSGSKIATTLLVIGIPVLDIIRVMIRRYQLKRSVFEGDNEHLHFKLLQSGLSQKQTVLLFYAMALLFGLIGLFVQSSQKIIALVFLVVLMLLLAIWFSKKESV